MSSSRAAISSCAPHPGGPGVGPLAVVQGEADALALTQGRTGPRRTSASTAIGTRARQDQDVGAAASRRSRRRPRRAAGAPGRTRVAGRTPRRSRPRPRVHVTCRSRRWGASVPEVVPPVALARRQRVDDDGGPGGGAVRRLQHHGAIQVATGDLDSRPATRTDQWPGRLAQQPTEDRRAVEARAAQPVDRTVAADQRGAVPIGQQGVVGDRARTHRWSNPRDRVVGGHLTNVGTLAVRDRAPVGVHGGQRLIGD